MPSLDFPLLPALLSLCLPILPVLSLTYSQRYLLLQKLREARKLIDASGRDIRLQVDGGVTAANIKEIAEVRSHCHSLSVLFYHV